MGGGVTEVILVSWVMGVVWVAIEVVLLAGEREATWVAEEMDLVVWVAGDMEMVSVAGLIEAEYMEVVLVAGLDFLAGAGAKQNDGKANRVIRGGTLTLRSIRATMTAREEDAGPVDDGAGLGNGGTEASRSRWPVAFHRRRLFIIPLS